MSTDDLDYHALNAKLNLYDADGRIQFDADREAARQYFLTEVNPKTKRFDTLRARLDFMVEEGYYEKGVLDLYDFETITAVFEQARAHHFRFPTFMGAYKFHTSYALKTFDGTTYLEHFAERVAMVALYLAQGDPDLAHSLVEEMMSGRFQPATPTFLNAGKAARGELVSCYLVRIEDNLESISRGINTALQLSKRGGGVALNLTNIREDGAPIKRVENQSRGVVPVMKLLEDSFSYANQLGARPGAGAVYLNAHHPDIMSFLDTKRENADEKIRIKTLSLGVVVPDITFELAKRNDDMYLFSPYDVERVYGVPFSDISVSEKYDEMVSDGRIRKTKIKARKFFQTVAELQFESGYPYMLFEDAANRANNIPGRIEMSNLCSEILQVSEPSFYNDDLSYSHVGRDISCNLGSLNVAKAMDSPDFAATVEAAIRALTAVSDLSDIGSVPSIARGNSLSHAIGLGQMNLHGYLARERVYYGSPEALEFTDLYFRAVAYEAMKASNSLARERGETFAGFENSRYFPREGQSVGARFLDYINEGHIDIASDHVAQMIEASSLRVPQPEDWEALGRAVAEFGLYNAYLQAVPPTGSISYINDSTSSIHPIVSRVEIRKEGKIGRVYYPAPYMTNDNLEYYQDAYEIGPEKIIDTYATATRHVDQGLSLTLFYPDTVTTRDLNRTYIYAWRKGIKTLYYMRIRQQALEGTQVEGCVSCML